jgi:hypothetical protein
MIDMKKILYTLRIDEDIIRELKAYCENHREQTVSRFIRTAICDKLKSLQSNNQSNNPHNVLLDQWRREEVIDNDKKRQAAQVLDNTGSAWLPQDERPRWRR